MVLYYLASPYSHPCPLVRSYRVYLNALAVSWLWNNNNRVFSPLLHNHTVIEQFNLNRGWEFFKYIDEQFLSRCDVLLVLKLPGWQESVGVKAEMVFACHLGMRIEYLDPESLKGR